MTALVRRTLLGAAVALAAGAATFHSASTPAAGACLLQATYLQAPYIGVGSLAPAEVGGVVGIGTVPACNDTPGSGIDVQPSETTLLRVRGVAPRFAVALPGGRGGPAGLVVADGTPCLLSSADESLMCLRRRTKRLLSGPAVVTYPSATAGSVITVGVHVRDRAFRRRASFGPEVLLQRRDGDVWRSVATLAGQAQQVRLPGVAAGLYRVGKRVTIAARPHWLFATLTILPAPPPCTPPCTHA
jgi:hypothetical protein